MKKKQESIWEMDITRHIIGVLAVFGLVVSSLVATLGVTAVGVQAQVAFAQQVSAVSQTAQVASAVTTDDTPSSGVAAGGYCPQLSTTFQRGATDATTDPAGQVTELQKFLTDYYDINTQNIVVGTFGRITQSYVVEFQQQEGLPSYGIVGSLTRAAIASVCGQPATAATSGTTNTTTTVTPTTAPASTVAPAASNTTSANTKGTAFLTSLYSCILRTTPDQAGLTFWLNQLPNSTQLAVYNGFFNSSQYAALNTSNSTYVTQLYQCLLLRAPDTTIAAGQTVSGFQFWLNALQGGQSRSLVLQEFMQSNEYQTNEGPAVQSATGMAIGVMPVTTTSTTNTTATAPTISSINPNTGTTGTAVAISGANLSGVSSIQFYNSSGTFISSFPASSLTVTSTSVSFTLPGTFLGLESAGTYQIAVVAPGGTSNQLTFTVTAPQTTTTTTSTPAGSIAPMTTTAASAPSGSLLSQVSSPVAFWTYLYSCVLGRQPNTSELKYWTSQPNMNFTSAYQSFFDSSEYLASNTSNAAYLTQVFQCVLFRAPDSGGYTYWLSQLNSGYTRDNVLQSFINSSEFQTNIAPTLHSVTSLSFANPLGDMMASVIGAVNTITVSPFQLAINSLTNIFVELGVGQSAAVAQAAAPQPSPAVTPPSAASNPATASVQLLVPTNPAAYYSSQSQSAGNAASAVLAVNEISDGYSRLFQSILAGIGL